ncbi:MAG: twin-arginine translocation signal domain-containing protein [Nitrospiraceae bacterium]|nr:twin-arginine translocation signal domain-containing protein [Nitrospiraceae bacterium]
MYKANVSRRDFLKWSGVAASVLTIHSVAAVDEKAKTATKDSVGLLTTPSGASGAPQDCADPRWPSYA